MENSKIQTKSVVFDALLVDENKACLLNSEKNLTISAFGWVNHDQLLYVWSLPFFKFEWLIYI